MADSKTTAEKKIYQKWDELRKKRVNLGRKSGTIVRAPYGGWYQVFEKGRIYSHHSVGTYEVHGNNLKPYLERNQYDVNRRIGRREFGFPTADEKRTPDNLYPLSQFEWGQIIAFPGTYGGVSISGDIYTFWKGLGAGFSSLGYPINGNTRVAGGEAVFFERGCLFLDKSKSSRPFSIAIHPPLLGRPAMVTSSDKTLDFIVKISGQSAFRSLGGLPVLANLLNDRYYLQEVGTYHRIPLILQSYSIQSPREVKVHLSIPANRTLKDRTLYDIVFRMDNRRYYALSPHAVYAKASWDNFGLVHATDIHIARRIDGFRKKLIRAKNKYRRTDLDEGIKHLNNWNDRFRDLIRYANQLHKRGKLDAIIATGDIVDYLFEERDNKHGGGNFEYFKKLVLGKLRYPDSNEKQEELKVPIFTTLGNHDYRINPYKLLAELSIFWGAIDVKTIEQYSGYNITETEARAIQDGRPKKRIRNPQTGLIFEKEYGKPEIDSDQAKKMVAIDKAPKYYLKYINRDFSYSVKLGQNRLLMLDAGYDVGTPDGILDTLIAYGTMFGSEDTKTILKGSPNTRGLQASDLELVAKALNEAKGAVIIGTHSPPINTHGKEYPHYFRETEHLTADDKEIANYLRRRGEFPNHPSQNSYHFFTNDVIVKQVGKNFKDWPLSGTPYFKTGDHENYLDFGVSRGDYMKDFLKLCAGGFATYGRNKINRPVDLVLFGHVHSRVEMRLKWRASRLEYYHDFYTENPEKYYASLKYTDKYGSYKGVRIVVDKDAKLNEDVSNGVLKVPPYSSPLSDASDPVEWWRNHRPLFIQGAPSGPLDNKIRPRETEPNFQGVRLISVSNNAITKATQIPDDELRKLLMPANDSKWLEAVLNVMLAAG